MNRSYLAVLVVVIVLAIGAMAVLGSKLASQSESSQNPGLSSKGSGSATTGSSSASSGSQGALSFLATDPPVTASGVSKVYVRFSGEDVHGATSAAASGWVGLNSSGTIELTSLVNTTQTIASSKIRSGAYDMARLDVTSATVLYNGKNYTASVPSGDLTASFSSRLQVNGSTPSAAVIDLHTVIMNTGNATQPQFLFSASAKATVVPAADVSASVAIGARTDFHTKSWWNQFIVQSTAVLQITSANVTSGSLRLVVSNNGGASTTLHLVTITPVSVSVGIGQVLPPTLTGSATFVVNQDGTLSSSAQPIQQALFGGPGMNIAAGSSASLSYTGTIQLGRAGFPTAVGLLQGQRYMVTVISNDSSASLIVVAG